MTDRWKVVPKHVHGGPTTWRVHDGEDRDRPVAEFADEASANAHAERLAAGPFDWDEQEAWKDDDWGEPPARRAPEDGGDPA